jgi:hypothetical protein
MSWSRVLLPGCPFGKSNASRNPQNIQQKRMSGGLRPADPADLADLADLAASGGYWRGFSGT